MPEREGIERIELETLNHRAYLKFHGIFSEIIGRRDARSLKVEEEFDGYRKQLYITKNAWADIPGTKEEKKGWEIGDIRDKALDGLVNVAKSICEYYRSDAEIHIDELEYVLNRRKNTELVSYLEETAEIKVLLADLRECADDNPAFANLGLTGWISELEKHNAVFEKYVADGHYGSISERDKVMEVERGRLDAGYAKIVRLLNAYVALDDKSPVKVNNEFVRAVNTLIGKFTVARW